MLGTEQLLISFRNRVLKIGILVWLLEHIGNEFITCIILKFFSGCGWIFFCLKFGLSFLIVFNTLLLEDR